MALEFQPRADGYRVVRGGGGDHMIASISMANLTDPGKWVPKPYEECSIHTAGGPMTVGDLEEMIAKIKADCKAALAAEIKAAETAAKAAQDKQAKLK